MRFIIDRKNNRIACCSTTNQRPSMKYTGCSSPSDCQIRRKYLEAKKCPPTCEQDITNVGKTCLAYHLGDWENSGILQCSMDATDSSQAEYFVFSKRSDVLSMYIILGFDFGVGMLINFSLLLPQSRTSLRSLQSLKFCKCTRKTRQIPAKFTSVATLTHSFSPTDCFGE